MYGISAISDQPFASYPSGAVLIPFPILSVGWATRASAAQDAVLESTYAVLAGSNVFTKLEIVYEVTQAPANEVYLTAAWATHAAVIVEVPLDPMYVVTATSFGAAPLDPAWQTRGVVVEEPTLNNTWAVLGAPQGEASMDVVYAVQETLLELAPLETVWATNQLYYDSLVLETAWAVYIPVLFEFPMEAKWFFNFMVANALSIVYSGQVRAALDVVYQLGLTKVRNGLTVTSPMLSHVAGQLEVNHPIAEVDTVQQQLSLRYSLLDGSVVLTPAPPALTVKGRLITLQDVEISAEEGQYAWTCQAVLPDPALLNLFERQEPFTVNIGGETFSFIATETRLARGERPVKIDATVAGISPSALYAEPYAEKVTKTWDTAVLVSDVLEELFGPDVVELRGVQDWAIPAGRLSVNGQTPMEIASQIAQATGALLESDPDGSLYMRPAWPVPVPFLETVEPDHTYDDLRDVFTVEERTASSRLSNRIRIMDAVDAASGLLLAEVDSREDGYNPGGRTSFMPGEQPAILIFKSSRVELDAVRPSAGNVVVLAAGTMEVEESLSFAGTAEATLRYPTAALTSYKWLGNDLGVPTLVNELTVQVPTVGVGKLLVEYDTAFEARRISGVPAVLNGETEYEVLVLVEGSQT